MPGHEEYAIGAVASGGIRVLNEEAVRGFGLSDALIDRVAAKELAELNRRERLYRGDRPEPAVDGRTVILVDDGLATGASMMAAVRALKSRRPGRLVVAVPIAAAETCAALESDVDEVVCALTPEPFHAVGLWYESFSQTTDEEVHRLLEEWRRP
jgi:putative phosphoribosyl transferase